MSKALFTYKNQVSKMKLGIVDFKGDLFPQPMLCLVNHRGRIWLAVLL